MGHKCVTLLILFLGLIGVRGTSKVDYGEALSKCILFFEGQRSGKLPSTQRMSWRKDSGLKDGSDISMNLVGGYYDAGDNVKFNFPMAFTTAMLAWSLDALRWGTDYLLKATNIPGTVVAVVGDPNRDHSCWERPEDMDTLRTSYVVNRTHPGSEVSAEIAAALAAASIVFRETDKTYSDHLVARALQVFAFADRHQGSYKASVGEAACPFYCDYNGYWDELVWGATWLYKATEDSKYWNYVTTNTKFLKPLYSRHINGMEHKTAFSSGEFGWDAKDAGINVLVAKILKRNPGAEQFIQKADDFVCSVLPESPTKSVTYSPGGLLFKSGSSNMQHVTSLSFLLLVYASFLRHANRAVYCGNVAVDYILGKNPQGMSYMVGYGNKFPQRIHHRASSLPSVDDHRDQFGCHDGNSFIFTKNPNKNVLIGAIVGGPDENDKYIDNRLNVSQSEPATYMNAPLVGVLAFFKESTKYYY
ncbi:hypothetical protein K2173_014552 [Erythroxylum novogranatense]|uniref:Endoglucanase n=1 Tax=Erythroxylum novogranatense TaxID=1862640 RepID=A0AAV8S743_9ROSI|nr:hypothetical protein K2173_014552 [Erythroxylum novogranatense]